MKATQDAQRTSPALRVEENGVAAYLVEAKAYEAMQRRLRLLEGLARGENAIAGGKTTTHARARKRLARWLR
jgi:PHD/YefM family antitoxin component YafN of YafNO toxin-antitoxin module